MDFSIVEGAFVLRTPPQPDTPVVVSIPHAGTGIQTCRYCDWNDTAEFASCCSDADTRSSCSISSAYYSECCSGFECRRRQLENICARKDAAGTTDRDWRFE